MPISLDKFSGGRAAGNVADTGEGETPKTIKHKKPHATQFGGASFKDIGEEMGITPERVRQISQEAMINYLRKMAKESGNVMSMEQAKELLQDPEMEEAIATVARQAFGLTEHKSNLRLAEIADLDVE